MKYSVIVAFKNRDQRRVEFFLESLKWQTDKDFELIFVNQGSNEDISLSVENLIRKYPFATYIYNHTQGHLWNKSNALNIGIKSATAKHIVITDIDIIFPKDFFEKIGDYLAPGIFTTHNAYYLPEEIEINKIDTVFTENFSIKCVEHFIGLCVATRVAFTDIKGYDEFFLVWGAEDDDIIKRLEERGETRLHLSANSFQIFHQWHTSRAPSKPSLWYLIMVNYLFGTNQVRHLTNTWGMMTSKEERPLLELRRVSNSQFIKLHFWENNQMLFFNPFFHKFFEMEAGKIAYLSYEFEKEQVSKSFLYTLFVKDSRMNENENKITKHDIVNFFEYFIGENRPYLLDYYFECNEKLVKFYCIKK